MSSKNNRDKIPWETIRSKRIYQNPWYALREDQVRTHTGEQITYTYMEHPGAVAVVPVTRAGEIILIRSYRHTIKRWCWEVPMGGRDHDDLRVVARKELLEETGGKCDELQYVNYFFSSNGVSDGRCDVFLGWNVQLGARQPERTELIEVTVVPMRDVFQMARSGEIHDGMSALALFLCESIILERKS